MLVADDEVLPLEDDVEDEEQDEEHAEGHHDMEGVEDQRDIGHQVLRLLDVVVAEVVEVLLENGLRLGHRLGISGLFGCLIVGQGRYCGGTHGLLLDEGRLDVGIAFPVGELVAALDDVVDAGHEAVCLTGGQEREHVGEGYLEEVGVLVRTVLTDDVLVRIQDTYGYQRSLLRAVVETLHGGELHGLHLGHVVGRAVTGTDEHGEGYDSEDGGHADGLAGQECLTFPEQEPGGYGDYEYRGEHVAVGHRVEEFVDGHGGRDYRPEVHHLAAGSVGIELHAHGILHPGVGDEDPDGGEVGSYGGEPGGYEVGFPAHLVPAEVHHCEEGALHEKCEDTLDGQRSAEDVAHEP